MLYIVLTEIVALFITVLFVWGAWEIGNRPSQQLIKHRPRKLAPPLLTRHAANPLIKPSSYEFENNAVLNPAAIHDGDRTHIFYRALGSDGVSRIGYAESKDGTTLDDRLPYPVFALENPQPEYNDLRRAYAEKKYPSLVASGGSWGGTEDPRAVLIDDRVYLSFSAFHNWDSVRITVTSIALDDVKAKRWKWSKPTFLSRPNEVHKNWVLFPQKINGMFAILHSISPTIQIAYRKNLESVGTTEPFIDSPKGPRTQGYEGQWDNWVRGAGPPPLRVDNGWLLFYHATNRETQGHLYQIGAMLLDATNPTTILARSKTPVLTPQTEYEMGGAKPGVVYACGTTLQQGMLHLYYGAADNFVCSAMTPLTKFMSELTHTASPSFTSSYMPVTI